MQPLFDVISTKVVTLKLGEPRLEVGPTYITKDFASSGDRIRKGAVWWIAGKNTGFHVDFLSAGVHIEAWQGKERHASVWISGKVTEATLRKDLSVVLVAAGLTDLARTESVRERLFPATKAKG